MCVLRNQFVNIPTVYNFEETFHIIVMSLLRRSDVRLHLRACISAVASFPRSHKPSRRSAAVHSRGTERRTRVERTTWAHLITQRWSAMRVLTSFSLLGGTAQCAHNAHELYAATVKPGRISRRRNLNSWKREREERGCVYGRNWEEEKQR